MAAVDRDTANWRLFGGGGLIVGGGLWTIGTLLALAAVSGVPPFVVAVGMLLVAIACFLVAFGETGSNGAVGNAVFGKLALIALGVGWAVFAVIQVLAAIGIGASTVLEVVGAILVVGGGVLSTFAIYDRRVARGAARWVLAVPTVISVLWVIIALGWIGGGFSRIDVIVGALLALAYTATGLLYLLNRRDVG